ncbi:MAG: PLP-dependent aminotransferase family protein [Chloroflexota bacterium]
MSFSFDNLYSDRAAPARVFGSSKRAKYDFAVAYPDPDTLPLDTLLDSLKRAFEEDGDYLALYAHMQGYPPLREYIAKKLERDRNIKVSADEIVVGDGSGQPNHLIIETLTNPGDVLFTDDFIYSGTLGQMRRFGADIRGIATDEHGMIPEALEEAILKARGEGKVTKLVYLVPTFQNPQGWTLPLERRKAILAISHKYDLPILEDDCYVDLRYDGEDVTSIYSLDQASDDPGRVIYVGSFSKIIAPGMRLGYFTGPTEFIQRAFGAKGTGSNTFSGFAVYQFAMNYLSDHIEMSNDLQRLKRDAMLAALEEHFSSDPEVTWSRPDGGLYIWLKLRSEADTLAIRDDMVEQFDVGYQAGTIFAPDQSSGKNCLRICYGYNTPEEIGEGIGRLAEGFRHFGQLA